MKYWNIFSILFLVLMSCSSTDEPAPTPTPTPDPDPEPTPVFELPAVEMCGYDASETDVAGWNLIFEDNFSTEDDLSKWTPWRGGAFNDELQHYQASNLYVENDLLYLRAQKGNVVGRTNPFDETQKAFRWTSGRVESKQTFGPTNVEGKQNLRYSARIRLVEGEGLWPAWWSYNDPWPTQGEIDVLEARGNTPFEFQSNFHFGNEVNRVETNPAFNEFVYSHTEKLSECFHVYEIEWSKEAFVIKFDNEVVKTYEQSEFEFVDDFFAKQHRLVLNLAVGGFFFTNVDESKIPSDSYLVVDWVRVYEK